MSDGARLVFGCMTGTSLDALDIAAVGVHGRGLDSRAEPLDFESAPLGGLAAPLRAFSRGEAMTASAIAGLSREFALLHAETALRLRARVGQPSLVAVHGQTVHHAPPVSWQLFSAAPLACAIGATVVHDLRAADLALGGQGAPITPLADWVLFRDDSETRAIVNLGGFCNVSVLPAGGAPSDVLGFDVCACNHVLDEIARKALGMSFDADGQAAAGGKTMSDACAALRARLSAQRKASRSLGSGDEAFGWVGEWVGRAGRAADLLATGVEAVAGVIGETLASHRPDRLIVAGGGALNQTLVRDLSRFVRRPVSRSDEFGVPVSQREAVCLGVLGALCEDRVPITLPRITGVTSPAPLAGSFTRPPAIA